ncbi:ribonuclease P protein component [Candidatus Kaiserbacteria bacterium]|nr:ribonuclease P protein component [Candidatus Kaiserbacteria bacterium]
MFPRSQRLARSGFSSAIAASGRRASSAHFSLVVPAGNLHGYAVVIPKKVARFSVTRHRLKRRVLSVLRALPLPPALIVFPKVSTLALSSEEIKAELASLLSKIIGKS